MALFIALRAPRVEGFGAWDTADTSDGGVGVTDPDEALSQFRSVAQTLNARGVTVMINTPEPLFARTPYMCADPWFSASARCGLPTTMSRASELAR